MIKEDFASAIRNQNAARICSLLLGDGDPPQVVRGAGTENELWDYKADVPSNAAAWARSRRHAGGTLLAEVART